MANQKWTAEREVSLVEVVGANTGQEVTVELVVSASVALDVSTRSAASKLRKMGYTVQSTAASTKSQFSDEQTVQLRDFIVANANVFTYAEIAAQVFEGAFDAKSIQGKILSMELTSSIKATEKQEAAKKYTDEETATVISMSASGAFVEDIAEALGKSVKSVNGKSLAISNSNEDFVRPKQRDTKPVSEDALSSLVEISTMTLEDISNKINKSITGVKTMLTHRALTCADYDGAKRAAKIAAKKLAVTAD